MSCIDFEKRTIDPNHHFIPGPDFCTFCICVDGHPKECKAILCKLPQNCKTFRLGSSCCEFICSDDALAKAGDTDHDFSAELGVRLIATAVTAILSLSLLFFLFHRLRQRKMRGRQDRELIEAERNLGSIGYIAGSLGYLPEHHFEENGAGYSLWKPNFYSRGEAPPPYEEALAAARAEAALARAPGPSLTSHMQTQHRTIPANLAASGSLLGSSSPLPVEPTIIPPPPLVDTPKQQEEPEEDNSTSCGNGEATETTSNNAISLPPPISSVVKSSSSTAATVTAGTESKKEGADESDDYRSECENCNMRQTPGYEEDLVTMTLHRRTGEQGDPHFYSRTSLTLPTHPRKQQLRCGNGIQSGVTISCARENWFSSMPETSSSEEEEEEE